jgi:hypothetical protein
MNTVVIAPQHFRRSCCIYFVFKEPSRMEEEPQYLLVMEALSVVAVSFSAVFLIISLVLYLGTW